MELSNVASALQKTRADCPKYRLESYSKDGDIISYKCWLSDQCMHLKKQSDSVSCLRWLAEFTDVRGLLPLEDHYFTSNSMYNLNEGFKLCIELRQIIQIAAKELLQRWLSISEPLHLRNDNIYAMLCRIKILFRSVSQVCQTESGLIMTSAAQQFLEEIGSFPVPITTDIFESYSFIRLKRYLEGILIEYDHLATKFKPLVPKQPRPSLLFRHVSENLPKSLPVSRNTGFDYEHIKQMIFERMKALIEKEALCVQDIFELHRLVTSGSEDARPGLIRDECVVVGETGQKGCDITVFLPASEVSSALHLLVELCYKDEKFVKRGAFFRSWVLYSTLVYYIHPFKDGNGRVGRFLSAISILQYGLSPFLTAQSKKVYDFEKYFTDIGADRAPVKLP